MEACAQLSIQDPTWWTLPCSLGTADSSNPATERHAGDTPAGAGPPSCSSALPLENSVGRSDNGRPSASQRGSCGGACCGGAAMGGAAARCSGRSPAISQSARQQVTPERALRDCDAGLRATFERNSARSVCARQDSSCHSDLTAHRVIPTANSIRFNAPSLARLGGRALAGSLLGANGERSKWSAGGFQALWPSEVVIG